MQPCDSKLTAPRDGAAHEPEYVVRSIEVYPRYEALLDLASRARSRASIEELAVCISNGWRFCANVIRWRLIAECAERLLVIDFDGIEIVVSDMTIVELPSADQTFWDKRIPMHLRPKQIAESPLVFPEHLKGENVRDIVVLPLDSEGRGLRILALICSGQPGFSVVDMKFVLAVGNMFASEVSYLMVVSRLTQALQRPGIQAS